VLAGPWQMDKVDQGVFTYWMLAHYFRRNLHYIGYGGRGKQVRDLLHVEDLAYLIEDQLVRPHHWDGATVNVGGGRDISLSLRETTELCREITGNSVEVTSSDESRPGDVRIYLSDCTRLYAMTDWRPQRSAREVLEDIFGWIAQNEHALQGRSADGRRGGHGVGRADRLGVGRPLRRGRLRRDRPRERHAERVLRP
jgi:CDP-paratose 2-epimerase